jgi:ParB-like chromosome segregation protein Spo0J
MADKPNIKGRDVKLCDLVPLNTRRIDLEKSRGYRKILCSVRSVGLIEPLCVYEEDGKYVILDGYLRYRACMELGLEKVPCIVHDVKEAYTFNRMVNQLSGFQEVKMLRKAMERLDESAIAEVFGLKTIRYRLSPVLLKRVHPDVAKAFAEDLISRNSAREFVHVTPDRQAEIVQEMRRIGDFSLKLLRALILKTDPAQRTPGMVARAGWCKDGAKRKELVSALREAEHQHDFYTTLYRQYTTDLLKMVPYVRKIVTNPKLTKYLAEHHPDIKADFSGIVLDAAAP